MTLDCMCCGLPYEGDDASYYCSLYCEKTTKYVLDNLFPSDIWQSYRIGEFLIRAITDFDYWDRLSEFDSYLHRPIEWYGSCIVRIADALGIEDPTISEEDIDYVGIVNEFLLKRFRKSITERENTLKDRRTTFMKVSKIQVCAGRSE